MQAAEFGRDAARVSVAGDVARTYLLLRGVQAQEKISGEHRQVVLQLLRMAASRERNGVATRFDVAAARADLARIEARLLQLQHQREVSMNALALLLGKPPRELDARLAMAGLPPMPRRLPISISSELARQRPDILQAEARLRAAVADIGGRLESNLALSESRHRLAGLAYQQTVLRAWHEVDDALDAYATETKRHEQLQLALEQSRTALFVAQRGYQEGSADFTSVLVARRSLLSSQSELADCATASALSVVSLYRALGGAWSPELRTAAPAPPKEAS